MTLFSVVPGVVDIIKSIAKATFGWADTLRHEMEAKTKEKHDRELAEKQVLLENDQIRLKATLQYNSDEAVRRHELNLLERKSQLEQEQRNAEIQIQQTQIAYQTEREKEFLKLREQINLELHQIQNDGRQLSEKIRQADISGDEKRRIELETEKTRLELRQSQLSQEVIRQKVDMQRDIDKEKLARENELLKKKSQYAQEQAQLEADLEKQKLAQQHKQDKELEELRTDLQIQKLRLEDELKQNEHQRRLASEEHEFDIWKKEVEFEISIAQRMIEIISNIKGEHTRKVMDVIIEFESRYQDAYKKAFGDMNKLREEQFILLGNLREVREESPEFYKMEMEDMQVARQQQRRLIDILLNRIQYDLPELRNYLLASANFDPVDFLVKITQGRANRQQITSILDGKIINLEAVKEEQKLLAPPKPATMSSKKKNM